MDYNALLNQLIISALIYLLVTKRERGSKRFTQIYKSPPFKLGKIVFYTIVAIVLAGAFFITNLLFFDTYLNSHSIWLAIIVALMSFGSVLTLASIFYNVKIQTNFKKYLAIRLS